jgi:hypothetical protein
MASQDQQELDDQRSKGHFLFRLHHRASMGQQTFAPHELGACSLQNNVFVSQDRAGHPTRGP